MQHHFSGPGAEAFHESITPSSISTLPPNQSTLSTLLHPETGGIVDDTSSVYTANTQDNQDTDTASVDLSSLALSEYNGESSASNGRARHHHAQQQDGSTLDEDFDAVLDDLKDEAAVDLPAHACRYAN